MRVKKVLLWMLVVSFVAVSFSSVALARMNAAKVKEILKEQGFSQVQILGVEPAPLKGLYMVYVKMPNGKKGAFLINDSGRYLLTGKLLDLKENRRDIIAEVGLEKGYLLPEGVSLKATKVKINTAGSPVFGSKKAPQVIVYFDPLCPYCLRELQGLKPLVDSGKIRLVLKFFIVHGEKARELASKAICLYQKGKKKEFWEFIFSRGAKGGELKSKCDEGKAEFLLTRDGEEAQKLKLRGTPVSIIKGKIYTGYLGSKVVLMLLSR